MKRILLLGLAIIALSTSTVFADNVAETSLNIELDNAEDKEILESLESSNIEDITNSTTVITKDPRNTTFLYNNGVVVNISTLNKTSVSGSGIAKSSVNYNWYTCFFTGSKQLTFKVKNTSASTSTADLVVKIKKIKPNLLMPNKISEATTVDTITVGKNKYYNQTWNVDPKAGYYLEFVKPSSKEIYFDYSISRP